MYSLLVDTGQGQQVIQTPDPLKWLSEQYKNKSMTWAQYLSFNNFYNTGVKRVVGEKNNVIFEVVVL